MDGDELRAFREQWKKEIGRTSIIQQSGVENITKGSHEKFTHENTKNRYFVDQQYDTVHSGKRKEWVSESHGSSCFSEERRRSAPKETEGGASSDPLAVQPSVDQRKAKDQPEYVSIAEDLLDGKTSPLRDRIQVERTRRKRQFDIVTSVNRRTTTQERPPCKVTRGETLIDRLIEDLNEINDIPFFDVELPYELALKIFQYLGRAELGRCAQVSKAWKTLAEDELLWYRLCLQEGYLVGASVSDSPCWKGTLRDCRDTEGNLRYNWKNRIGAISHLQYELGKVLCDVGSSEHHVIAGYTSGDVRLWDTLNWDSGASYLRPSHVTLGVDPRPHVSQAKVNGTVAAAAYEDGLVDVWSTESGQEPIHHYQHLQRVHAVALGSEGAAVATASGTLVRVDCPVDKGYWRTLTQAELPKPVSSPISHKPSTESLAL